MEYESEMSDTSADEAYPVRKKQFSNSSPTIPQESEQVIVDNVQPSTSGMNTVRHIPTMADNVQPSTSGMNTVRQIPTHSTMADNLQPSTSGMNTVQEVPTPSNSEADDVSFG